jgi:putative ABC transport system ATP-binding protein
VFQAFHLLDHQTCLENAALPALFARHDFDATARARLMLERLGIAEKAEVMPNVLSGGQKQRVAIARALLMEPSLLICDEPTGNLDHDTGLAILKVFTDIHREQGVTLVIVTHDDTIAAAAHRRIVLEAGVIREDVTNGAKA